MGENHDASSAASSGQEKNLSFVLQRANEVRYESRLFPTSLAAYDVLVSIRWTGICGSDVHYWAHGHIGKEFVVRAPLVLGHESAGRVVAVGSEVRGLRIGDSVALEPGRSCRRCEKCKAGKYNLCKEMAFAATPPYDGTLCEVYALPEDLCHKLPEGVSLEEGALVEPLSVAVHIVGQAGREVRPGKTVVVFGAGPVGLLCAAVARAFSASKVVVADVNPERLAFAEKYAATHTVLSRKEEPEDAAQRMREEAELGDGADVVIDASGAEPAIQTAIYVLRVGGTYVQGGMGKSEIAFPIVTMTTKELTVKGSFRYAGGDYPTAIELIASGKVDVKSLITGKVKFSEAEQAFVDVKAAKGIKILIEGVEE